MVCSLKLQDSSMFGIVWVAQGTKCVFVECMCCTSAGHMLPNSTDVHLVRFETEAVRADSTQGPECDIMQLFRCTQVLISQCEV